MVLLLFLSTNNLLNIAILLKNVTVIKEPTTPMEIAENFNLHIGQLDGILTNLQIVPVPRTRKENINLLYVFLCCILRDFLFQFFESGSFFDVYV